MKTHTYITCILLLYSLSLVSAVEINNVTIENSANQSIYANNTEIEELIITDSNITVKNALSKSTFTSLSNFTIFIRNLTEPFKNIYWDYANTIIDTTNEDISLTIGDRLLIYEISENITQVINNYYGGGGSTQIIYKYLDTINLTELIIDTSLLSVGDNELKFRTLDENGDLTIVDKSELYINKVKQPNKVKLVLNETYYYKLKDLEEGEYNITITVNQDGKELSKSKTYQVKDYSTVVEEVSKFWDKFKIWYYNYKTYIHFIGGLLLLLLIFFLILKKKQLRSP
jgi:signal peptidase I